MPIHNWAFKTTPQPGLGGRRGYQPRGKTLGGSSSINAMVYTRGHRSDYDAWAALGNPGWSYADVLPYFRRAEHNERLADAFHGQGGPLNVADPRSPSGFAELWLAAAEAQGLQRNADFNGAEQEGIGLYQLTQKNGERWSAASAYLAPNRHAAEPRRADAGARDGHRIRGAAGRRASTIGKHGAQRTVRARREMILAAGALQSPQLLLLSGVGDARSAALAGHPARSLHLPGVGRNLRDHVDFVIAYESPRKDLIGFMPGDIVNAFRSALRYHRDRRGIFASNIAEAGGFLKTSPELPAPDIQLHFCIGILESHGRRLHAARGFLQSCLRAAAAKRGSADARKPRSAGGADDRPGLLHAPRRYRNHGAGIQDHARDLAIADARSASRQGAVHRRDRDRRRNPGRAAPALGHDLPSGRNLPNGRRTSSRSSIPSFACAASRALRVVDASIMPTLDRRQHQRADDHDRRAGKRPHPERTTVMNAAASTNERLALRARSTGMMSSPSASSGWRSSCRCWCTSRRC